MTKLLNLEHSTIEGKLDSIKDEALKAHKTLIDGSGEGAEFTGWLDQPYDYDKEEFDRIVKAAEKIRKNSKYLVSVGIGGSYLGAKAVIHALTDPYDGAGGVVFTGNSLDSTDLSRILSLIKDEDVSVNVISKSGTTTETAIAFRFVRDHMIEKYGEEAKDRIFVTTDKEKGALKDLADEEGYETFVVPDDIGGRYSFHTAVGLLPIAAAGLDIKVLMEGTKAGADEFKKNDFENQAILYATARQILYREGKNIEILVSYNPGLSFLNEWWKQLYGESEGKDGQGIFPASVNFTTDLHSMGQLIQDGERNLFETVINIENPEKDLTIQEDDRNLDGLNYLAGKSVDYVNKKAMEGTMMAHIQGGVPNILLNIEKLDEYNLGYLMYFFMVACGVSAYIQGVNPFDQPGVEDYKANMFKLLGKPE